ncbi:putative membrane protein US8A [Equid alphaherpesvirus 3]|uniref:Putative membrane protein US8A n=1 Tax=Equid alphaherpesvirus 3 TaxID=80341 RepID=A0A077BCP7_9ALPH|nr:putative membrane protein US8A [Equid alphaherpesvirus 3]AIL02993.1 putative membrane protein US8A [Equid alphaherpesvirus 3]
MSRRAEGIEAALDNACRPTGGARARRMIAVSASSTFQEFMNSISRYRRASESDADSDSDFESETEESRRAPGANAGPDRQPEGGSAPNSPAAPAEAPKAPPEKPEHSIFFHIASRLIADLLVVFAVPVVYDLFMEYYDPKS